MSPGARALAVQVPCWVDQTLIGLGDFMHMVGDGSALRWRLSWVEFIGDVRAVWPQGHEEVEALSRQSGGLSVSWSQMTALAGTDAQIVDGEFIGFQDDGAPRLQFIMFDSSFWTVWSDRADYADLRAAFSQAVMTPHEVPASL